MTLAHSPLGPSSAHRWMNCPGSVAATADAPDRASAHSVEGTAAHTLTEWCRLHGRRADSYLGETIVTKRDGQSYGVVVDHQMVDAVNAFLDYVDDLPGLMLVEEKVDYSEYVPGGFGTADDVRLSPGLACVTDFKYGQGVPVTAEDNEQLLLYALGVMLAYDYLYEFKEFRLSIHQPRIDNVTAWTVSREHLLRWVSAQLLPAVRAVQSEAPAFKAGDWCRWCRIKDTCKTRAESVFETLVGEFDDLDAAIPLAGKARTAGTLTNDQIGRILEVVPQIETWIKDIEARAITEIAHGRKVGDWKLVEGRGSRDWTVPEAELKVKWAGAGLDPLGLYETKMVSPAKAEKLIGKKHEFWQAPGLVAKSKGKPVLAPGSDKRPPITVDADTEFDNLEESQDD